MGPYARGPSPEDWFAGVFGLLVETRRVQGWTWKEDFICKNCSKIFICPYTFDKNRLVLKIEKEKHIKLVFKIKLVGWFIEIVELKKYGVMLGAVLSKLRLMKQECSF